MRRLTFYISFVSLLLFTNPAWAGFVDHFANPNDIGMNKVPRLGHSRLLVIPVNLDTNHRRPLDMKALKNFYREAPDKLSFPGYWRDNSSGRYTVSVDVAKPVSFSECPFPIGKDCTPSRRDFTALSYGIPLIREVITRAHKESDLDLRRYDINGPYGKPDGWSDGVLIVMNGGWFGVALPFGIAEPRLIVTFDGVRVPVVAISSGPRALGMSIHEFGHLLGFADLYDEWQNTFGVQLSLMGGYRYDKRNVPLLDAVSRMLIGWAEMEQISGSRSVLIPPAASTGKVYKLGTGREFFLVENRQPYGPYDRHVREPGLAVYRVNMDQLPAREGLEFLRTVVDCPNCRRWRPFVMDIQADRQYEIQYRLRRFDPGDLFRSGDAFTPIPMQGRLSASNVWFGSNALSGRPSEIAITNIDTYSSRPFIRATLAAPFVAAPCAELRCPSDRECAAGACRRPLMAGRKAPQTTGSHLAFSSFSLPLAASSSGCSCAEDADWGVFSILLLTIWLLARGPLRRRYERHLKKRGKLDDDDHLRGRF